MVGALCVTSSISVSAESEEAYVPNTAIYDEKLNYSKEGHVPNYMLPNTVIVYDEEMNFTVEQGGIGDVQENSDVYATPGMKAVYDEDGLLRNVYYPSGEPGEYQLSNPVAVCANTGVRSPGSGKYTYGKNVLNFKASNVVGTGQITYYGKPDNPQKDKFPSDHYVDGKPYYLKVGDCATKMNVDDVPSGVRVKATNLANGNTKVYKKQDCGALPNAILDIFEDGKWSKTNGICALTVNNAKDSVTNGKISHPYNLK